MYTDHQHKFFMWEWSTRASQWIFWTTKEQKEQIVTKDKEDVAEKLAFFTAAFITEDIGVVPIPVLLFSEELLGKTVFLKNALKKYEK